MMDKVNMMAIKLRVFVDTVIYNLKNKEAGAVDIVAIIILIAVAVAVALIFRKQLANLVETIMGTVNQQAQGALEDIGG